MSIGNLYLRLMFSLVCSMILIVATAAILTRLTHPSNPFSEFGYLFTRDGREAAQALGFACHTLKLDSQPRPITDYCVVQIAHEKFSQISLGLSDNYANEITYTIRGNTLSFGDLVALWGEPDFWQNGEFVAATWRPQQVMAIALPPDNGRINYFLPVTDVSFTRSSRLRWSLLYLMGKLPLRCGCL